MIVSKDNLKIVKISKQDNKIPMLDNVYFTNEGATVASNGLAVVAVSPVNEQMKEHVVVDDKGLQEDIVISSESVKEMIKNLPKDTKYAGVLEHCVLENRDNKKAKFKYYDGRRGKSFDAKVYGNRYADFKEVFKLAYDDSKHGPNVRTAINLSRLLSMVTIFNEVCSDSSHNTAIFLEFTTDGNFIFRCTNHRTKQKIIGVMKAYQGLEGKIPELDTWEKDMFSIKKERKIDKVLKKGSTKINIKTGYKKIKKKLRSK